MSEKNVIREKNEALARELLGYVGAKYYNGDYPFDAGVMPEDASFDGKSWARGGTHPFFTVSPSGVLTVYGKEGRSGYKFSPASRWEDVGIIAGQLLGDSMSPLQFIELLEAWNQELEKGEADDS